MTTIAASDKKALKEVFDGFDVAADKCRPEVKLAPAPDFGICRPVWIEDDNGVGEWSHIKDHAKIGVRALLANPYFALFDEMGNMKTAQAIIAAQFLYMMGVINRVIVFAPANVRSGVWWDKDIGELSRHLFDGLPNRLSEFHTRIRQWDHGDWGSRPDQLRWIITNYEFVTRSKVREAQIRAYCGPKTLLILDESSAVKGNSTQMKATLRIRKACGRVILLNGTPIANDPIDLLYQGNMMHPSILNCAWLGQFRDEYCIMATWSEFPIIEGWKNLDKLMAKFGPYVLRRLKRNCLDLPPVLPPITVNVKLDEKPTWSTYKTMKDDLVTWVNDNEASMASQAPIKSMRLAQITSGFIGGVEDVIAPEEMLQMSDMPAFMQAEDWAALTPAAPKLAPGKKVHWLSREKLDDTISLFETRLAAEPNFKLLVWCRFKPEAQRMYDEFIARAKGWGVPEQNIALLMGGIKTRERDFALRLLHPRTAPPGPACLIATFGTGAEGQNFTAAHTSVDCSYDYSLRKKQQGDARMDRPGQRHAVQQYVFVAVGPRGQKTVDHDIIKVRLHKADIARRTTEGWLDAWGGKE